MSYKRKQRESCPNCVRSGRICDGLVPECMYYRRSAPLNPTRPRQIRNKEEEMYLEEHIRELEQRLDTLSSSSSTPRASPNLSARAVSTSPRSQDTYAGQHHIQVDGPGLIRVLGSQDPSEQPHPALLDSIYLFACSCTDILSPSTSLSLVGLEEHFLTRARKDMNDSLAWADRLLDYLKASNIIAAYLLRRGRHLEGYHHHSGAARLAMACGLHRIYSPVFPPHVQDPLATSPDAVMLLRPISTQMEVADRIFTFWNMFVQDQIYSVVHGFAPALDERLQEIITPLPRPLVEYEQNDIRVQDIDHLDRVFQGASRSPSRAESAFTSCIKGLALLRSTRAALSSRRGDITALLSSAQSFSRSITRTAEYSTESTGLMDRFLFSGLVCTQTALLQLSDASGTLGKEDQAMLAFRLTETISSPYNQQLARSSLLITHCLRFVQSTLEQHGHILSGRQSASGISRSEVEERLSMLGQIITPAW
ncbi:hypothetical protein FRB90_010019 [Tulasnella sp. 427]|nr:hypothetical protein FRB90_010019 [Tulasnella sp. 427]